MSPSSKIKSLPSKRSTRTADRVTRSQTSNRLSNVNNAIPLPFSASTSSLSVRTTSRGVSGLSTRRVRAVRATPTTSNSTSEAQTEDITHDSSMGGGTTEPALPSTPENGNTNVQIVDLITPQPLPSHARPVRRPLEVDLTCDLDDEVFVVLEDIVNPSRRAPVLLGSSPPPRGRTSVRSFRPTRQQTVEQGSPMAPHLRTVQSLDNVPPAAEVSSSTSSHQDSSHGIHCPICLDSLTQVKAANQQMHSTTCGHLFCGPCITRVLTATQQCPTCRKRLDIRKIHPIFI